MVRDWKFLHLFIDDQYLFQRFEAGIKLAGSQLEDALARGEDLAVSYSVADGDVKGYTQGRSNAKKPYCHDANVFSENY